jgi:hypothetical protein
MNCIGLERFFELPIIPAPERNLKLHEEMWNKCISCRVRVGAGYVCAALREALTSGTPVS